MEKTYFVAGKNWVAPIPISDIEHFASDHNIKIEAATRAIEALFKKRSDIEIQHHDPITITPEEEESDPLHATLVGLLQKEIEPGCEVGMVLCIFDSEDAETLLDGKEHEWYINSRNILQNAGVPHLVKKFDEICDKSVDNSGE